MIGDSFTSDIGVNAVVNVGVVGATGYTGVELLRLLSQHPNVTVNCITSRAESGRPIADLYPNLRGRVDLCFVEPDVQALRDCDVVFFATPHGVAQDMVKDLVVEAKPSPKIIDISADFRVRDIALWESWYDRKHACPELVDKAVYGLPELNRDAIRGAQIIACPGCYPTSILLGFMPLLEAGLIDPEHLIANAASGATGAGRAAKVDYLLTEISDSFKAYAASGHRHLPEIEQGLADIVNGVSSPRLTFIPHLLPIIRGIHATLYARLIKQNVDLQALFEQRYRDEPCVDVMPAGSHPQTSSVKGANMCRLSVFQPRERDTVVVLSVIDNLCKGASGQAVQCMNIMCGFEETAGIDQIAIMP
jgi:N-acetyl-gamma-glutamyl-phosphate reductase